MQHRRLIAIKYNGRAQYPAVSTMNCLSANGFLPKTALPIPESSIVPVSTFGHPAYILILSPLTSVLGSRASLFRIPLHLSF